MPGGRLTQQDRQQIAARDWPTASPTQRSPDVSTAPTSTITREVMRNGGPTAYRADLAHRATERHAPWRRQAAPPRPQSPREQSQTERTRTPRPCAGTRRCCPPPSSSGSGLHKMMSRVLVCLYTSRDRGSPRASKLVQRLQVRPKTISKTMTVPQRKPEPW